MADAPGASRDGDGAALRGLLEYLKANRGFDFSGYKRSSLERRIRKRMQAVELTTFEEYQDHLEVTPGEYTDLFNTILINVTGFFRDRPAWDFVVEDVVPRLLEQIPKREAIRIWSAACATGEEAYTIAMVLAEALGDDEFRRRVKIYATDVDEDALTQARHAAYPSDALKPLPDGFDTKYFEQGPLGHTVRGDLRRSVIFGRNDLVQDAPISKIDLLVSRNSLMYFTPETQARILGHFNFALKDTGFLFLGKSEMLFTPHNLKWRVFTPVRTLALRERLAFVTGDGDGGDGRLSGQIDALRSGAFDAAPMAAVLVDRAGLVTGVNHLARQHFNIGPADLGRPFQDVELSYRPVDLRSALERVYADGKPVLLGRVPWQHGNADPLTLEVTVAPLLGERDRPVGASIFLEDVTSVAELDENYERSKRQLETAYEELQSTVEELETTNEELHSTNEELETTNEELQSSNEELETMNEELHSTNDELEAMNDEQSERSAELDKVNLFLEGILGGLGVGVVVVDRDQIVQVWNANSQELWGLRGDEVEGQHLMGLDIGFPVERLKDPLRPVLAGEEEEVRLDVEAITRRGRTVNSSVRMQPLRTQEGEIYGALLIMAVGEDSDAAR